MKTLTGYHFTGDRLRNGDPIPPVGVWLHFDGPIVPCKSGLHISEHPFDALQYAPGDILHKVKLRGNLTCNGAPINKWAGRERMIIRSINTNKMLRDFARWNAMNVIHLWDAPKTVIDYLETGEEKLRVAAWDADWDTAWADAWASAWAATRNRFLATVEKAFEADQQTGL